MCMFGGGSTPSAPPPPEAPPEAPKQADEAVQRARDDEKKKALALRGRKSTVLTSGLADEDDPVKRTLLGGS